MLRTLCLAVLLLVGGPLFAPVYAQDAADLPPRPAPFRFVTDQAGVLGAEELKTLDAGLRRYADRTGTQVVVVLVKSLGGQPAGSYARALGTAWGVGQRGKNNGVVVLVAPTERQASIEAGSGLRGRITPALTRRILAESFGPAFKAGRYGAGLRAGLNTLLLAANPDSVPGTAVAGAAGAAGGAASADGLADNQLQNQPGNQPNNQVESRPQSEPGATGTSVAEPETAPFSPNAAGPVLPEAPAKSGWGLGTIALLVLGGGGLLLLLRKLFSRRAAPAAGSYPAAAPPDFTGRGNGPLPTNGPRSGSGNGNQPNYGNPNGPNQGGGMFGGNGPGLGGMLATGAAAAAGAYLGNRMAGGGSEGSLHPDNLTGDNTLSNNQLGGLGSAGGAGLAGAAGAPAAADYFGNRDGANEEAAPAAPDYFADEPANPNPDYFADDASPSSYDDLSSADTGGGGFDGGGGDSGGGDDSGSW